METAGYISRRMLQDVCDITTGRNDNLEPLYNALMDWMEVYTQRYSAAVLHRLPSLKTTKQELLKDMEGVYRGILTVTPDVHSMLALNCIFTVSLYMMIRYRETPNLSGEVAFLFQIISYRLGGWKLLERKIHGEAEREWRGKIHT